MTYARSRLWLGITGVGSVVTLATFSLVSGLPNRLLSVEPTSFGRELIQLASVAALFVLWLLPLDFLGGFWLPKRFRKSDESLGSWLAGYGPAVLAQSFLFVLFGNLILQLSQALGSVGAVLAISSGVLLCLLIRNLWILQRQVNSETSAKTLLVATAMIQPWGIFVPHTVVVSHRDIGFTGGIIGLGKRAKIIIPERWLSFPPEQLATAIARRAMAINSGSYSRGLAIAFMWNIVGFMSCALLPGAGLTSVAGLVMTICGFTVWSFLGLLLLPTVSRNGSLKIDQLLVQQGTPAELISQTAFQLDQLQDGEPERPAFIEAIFHPVPNVSSRNGSDPIKGLAAWNVARTTLFLSWACMGFLSRSVHCNVGRPELWAMLPTD